MYISKPFPLKILLILFFISTLGYSQNRIVPSDLNIITGHWEGSLTYMDYSTNQPYTMPANVEVKPSKNDYQVSLFFSYPNEPNANGKDKIKISKDGLFIDKAPITFKQVLDDNSLQVTTESDGKDNNKKALMKKIYVLGNQRFIIRKEVKFLGSDEWLVRNEYSFKRKL